MMQSERIVFRANVEFKVDLRLTEVRADIIPALHDITQAKIAITENLKARNK